MFKFIINILHNSKKKKKKKKKTPNMTKEKNRSNEIKAAESVAIKLAYQTEGSNFLSAIWFSRTILASQPFVFQTIKLYQKSHKKLYLCKI